MARKRRGVSLAELLVAMAIFGLIMGVCVAAMSESSRVFRGTSGRDTAMAELGKARKSLLADVELTRAGTSTFQVTQVPASQGSGKDGDAIDLLSPREPSASESAYAPDGTVFWMRNVTYYVVVPSDHDGLAGGPCAGASDAQGYDDACPHKILVRRVTDQSGSDPANPASEQTLLSPFDAFPRVPVRTANLLEKTVAVGLLSFRCTVVNPAQIQVDLRAVSVEDARRELGVGSRPLSSTRFAISQVFQIFPKN